MKNLPIFTQPSVPTRRLDRDSLLLHVLVRLPDGKEEYEGRIRNISAGGLMVEILSRVVLCGHVDIKLHNVGWVSGRIVWESDGRIGVAFENFIDPKAARRSLTTKKFEVRPYLKRLNKRP